MTGEAPPQPQPDKDVQLALLAELGNALRARSEPEHLYTAAAIGSFGAFAWGVAALRPQDYICRAWYKRPAVVAIASILIVASLVVYKIFREHRVYRDTKREQARIARRLASLPGATDDLVPEYMKKEKAGRGYLVSVVVVIGPALAAIAFCCSLAY